MPVGCWCLPPRTEAVATWQPSPWVPLPTDVFACHHNWSEWTPPLHLQGWREPSPEWDLDTEPTTMELVGPDSTCQHREGPCWDVYQLWRLPKRGWCKEAMEECLWGEVLESIKECLWLKWPSAQPEVEQKWFPADASWPDPPTEFVAANCSTCEKFAAMKEDSYEEMMALVRDAHWWALVVAGILEDRMERMSHSTSHQCFASCWYSSSHWWRRSRSLGHQENPQTERMGVSFHQQVPRWLHAEGAPFDSRLSHHLVPSGRSTGGPSPKGWHPCWQKRAWNAIPG